MSCCKYCGADRGEYCTAPSGAKIHAVYRNGRCPHQPDMGDVSAISSAIAATGAERRETIKTLSVLSDPQYITRENIDRLLDTHQLQVRMKNGNWREIRRNGATKRWKRDAHRIYVPFKFDFRNYGNITEADFVDVNGIVGQREAQYSVLDPLYYRVKPAPGTER